MKGDISELYRKVGDGVLSFSPSSCPIKVFQSVISLSRTYVSLDIIDATLDRVGWWRYYSVRWGNCLVISADGGNMFKLQTSNLKPQSSKFDFRS